MLLAEYMQWDGLAAGAAGLVVPCSQGTAKPSGHHTLTPTCG